MGSEKETLKYRRQEFNFNVNASENTGVYVFLTVLTDFRSSVQMKS